MKGLIFYPEAHGAQGDFFSPRGAQEEFNYPRGAQGNLKLININLYFGPPFEAPPNGIHLECPY